MNGTLKEYYKRSLYKGRSQLSRIIDFVFLRLLILASTYIYFLSTVDSKVVILFTFVTTALISFAVLAVVYTLVYKATSNAYYRIVKGSI